MDITIPISLVIFVVLMFSGTPVPFSFLGAILFLVITLGYDPSFLLPAGFAKLNSVVLLALPFFVATGCLVAEGGVAKRLIALMDAMVGRLSGGLGVVAVVVSAVFGAISGAAASSVVAIGTIMIPQMETRGYPRGYSTALISSAAVLSTMIPPSLAMIMFAFVTAQSVAACFLATVGPAIILMVLFSIINMFMARKIPTIVKPPRISHNETLKKLYAATKNAFWALMLPVIILGGIYGGIMTPTEAAAVSIFYTILVSVFIYREMSWGKALLFLRRSCCITGTMMLMTFFAAILSRIYTMEQVPQQVAVLLLGITTNKVLLLLMVNLFLILTGMIMDELSGILLATPLLFPVMMEIGVNPIHFAAIIGANLGMGMMTPPMAGIMYIGARIGNVTIDKMLKPSFILILFGSIPVIILTTYWPELSLFLPRLAGVVD